MKFAKPGELYAWIRSNWEVEVLHEGSKINHMKTAGPKKLPSLYEGKSGVIS